MKTLRYSIMAKLTLAVSMFVTLFSACSPDLDVSKVKYYYLIKQIGSIYSEDYILQNDIVTSLPVEWTQTIINESDKRVRHEAYAYNDCYIKNGQMFYLGIHKIQDDWVEQVGVESYANCHEIILSETFIEINGVRKTLDIPGVSSAISIIPDNDTIYYLFRSSFETGQTDHNGLPLKGLKFYVSTNGEDPIEIAEQREIVYDTKMANVEKLKKINGKFYFVGTRDQVGFFAEASQLQFPYYLTGHGGAAYDLVEYDSTIIVCGTHESKAYLFDKTTPIELPLPEGTIDSEARCMAVAENDLYVGGRIDDKPAIWKNGEILAIFDDFPAYWGSYGVEGMDDGMTPNYMPIREEFGWVCGMVIDGNTIYSIVETSNYANDHKRFALEWHINDDKVSFLYNYDIVQMLKLETIKMKDNYYGKTSTGRITYARTNYSTPRILLQHAKAKRKK